MVKKNNSDSVEPKIDSTPRSKAAASKKPAEKTASAKTPATKKPAAKTTKAEVAESAPAAKKPTEKKPAAKKPIEKKPAAKGASSKTEGKPAATAAPVTVTATSMLFMAPDLPTPVIDKKRGRPIEDKKTADQGETHVRRRSRRREGELAEGEQLPPNTVVKVRTPRERKFAQFGYM